MRGQNKKERLEVNRDNAIKKKLIRSELCERVGNALAIIWTLVIVGIIPNIIGEGYYYCADIKYRCYVIFVCAFSVILFIYNFISSTFTEEMARIWCQQKPVVIALSVWLCANMVSFLLAKDKWISWGTMQSSPLGLSWYIILFLIWFDTSLLFNHIVKQRKYIFIGLVCAYFFTVIIAAWQFLGGNPFGLNETLPISNAQNFLSLLGNTGIFGQYICVQYPVLVVLGKIIDDNEVEKTISKKRSIYLYLSYLVSAVAGIALLISNTDATVLGFALSAVLFALVAWKKKESFAFYMMNAAFFLFGQFVFFIFYRIVFYPRKLSAIGRMINARYLILFILAALCVEIAVIIKRLNCETILGYLQNVVRVLTIVGFLGGAGAFGFFSIINRDIPLGRLENVLRFSESWGTERGFVWKLLFDYFGQENLIQKLFGNGQGQVFTILDVQYSEYMQETIGYTFYDSHNIYIYYLIEIGIIGLLAYVLMWLIALRMNYKYCMQRINQNEDIHAGKKQFSTGVIIGSSVAILTYMVMDTVMIQQPLVSPILYVALAFSIKKNESKHLVL